MSLTQEQRDLIASIQSLALSGRTAGLYVSVSVASLRHYVWVDVSVSAGGENLYRGTACIDEDGQEACRLSHETTLAEQRDALAALIVEHRRQAA